MKLTFHCVGMYLIQTGTFCLWDGGWGGLGLEKKMGEQRERKDLGQRKRAGSLQLVDGYM